MKYLQFDKDGILTLVSKTRVKQDDLEVEDSYNFQKEKEVDLNDEKVTILVDKTKEEILEELYPKLSDEALAKLEADKLQAELKAKRESDMLEGAVYTLNKVEYNVSFTKNDGDGLVQVKASFELGQTETVIHFDNGTNMPIKAEEFLDFATWFVNKRNIFFIGKGE